MKLECADSKGLINSKGDPVCKEGQSGALFYSCSPPSSASGGLLGLDESQFDHYCLVFGGGDVRVGVAGNVADGFGARVSLLTGLVTINSSVSHDGKSHADLSHNEAIFKPPKPGQSVYFRVVRGEQAAAEREPAQSRSAVKRIDPCTVKAAKAKGKLHGLGEAKSGGFGQYTVEMMVEGVGVWGHLTPNCEPLLPKQRGGKDAMAGLRVYIYLDSDQAIARDLRVPWMGGAAAEDPSEEDGGEDPNTIACWCWC
jgi:hypothetical protein